MPVVIMEKGQSVKLRGAQMARRVVIGCGWDPKAGQSEWDFDLDATLVARLSNGEAIDDMICYYGRLTVGDWAKHSADDLTGMTSEKDDDETIDIELNRVPPQVAYLDVVVNIYDGARRNQVFSMVGNAFVRLVNGDTGAEIARYDLTNEDAVFDSTGLFFARLKRVGPTWEFQIVADSNPAYATLASFANTLIPDLPNITPAPLG